MKKQNLTKKVLLTLGLGAVLLTGTSVLAEQMDMSKMHSMKMDKMMDITTCEKVMSKMHTSSTENVKEEKDPFAFLYRESENN